MHDVMQDEDPTPMDQEQHDRSFDFIKIKYLNFDYVKSVIFTKLVFGIQLAQDCCLLKIKASQ